jgi:hypothetical protein
MTQTAEYDYTTSGERELSQIREKNKDLMPDEMMYAMTTERDRLKNAHKHEESKVEWYDDELAKREMLM